MHLPRFPHCRVRVLTPDGPGTAVDGFHPAWARVRLDSGPKRNYLRTAIQLEKTPA